MHLKWMKEKPEDVTMLGLESRGSWLTMPKNFPGTGLELQPVISQTQTGLSLTTCQCSPNSLGDML